MSSSPSEAKHPSLVVCNISFVGDHSSYYYECPTVTTVVVVLMSVSCVFMVLTLAVFTISRCEDGGSGVSHTVPAGTPKKCLISEVTALLISFLLLIVAHSSSSLYGTVYCTVLGEQLIACRIYTYRLSMSSQSRD